MGEGFDVALTQVSADVFVRDGTIVIEAQTPVRFDGSASRVYGFAKTDLHVGTHVEMVANAGFAVVGRASRDSVRVEFDEALELELACSAVDFGNPVEHASYESIRSVARFLVSRRVAVREAAGPDSRVVGWVGRDGEEVAVRAVFAPATNPPAIVRRVAFYFAGARVEGFVDAAAFRPEPEPEPCELPCIRTDAIAAMFRAGTPTAFGHRRLVLQNGSELYASSVAPTPWGALADRAEATAFAFEHGRYRIDGARSRHSCGPSGCAPTQENESTVRPATARLQAVESSPNEMWIEGGDVVVVGGAVTP